MSASLPDIAQGNIPPAESEKLAVALLDLAHAAGNIPLQLVKANPAKLVDGKGDLQGIADLQTIEIDAERLLIGAMVPLASLPMAIVLLTAMFTVHWQYGFSSIKLQAITPTGAQFGPPGFETDLLYLAGLATLVIGGSGPFSVDRFLAGRLSSLDPSAGSPASDARRGYRGGIEF